MTLETTLEDRCAEYLIHQGAHSEKQGQDSHPDRLVFWGKSRHFWVEFKKKGTGRIRPGQKVYAKYLRAICDEVHFVDTFEQFVALVEVWKMKYGGPTSRRDKAFNP